ncbi:MAG: hypothetical protein C7B45_17520, partial [Sulfobacillus acidophilus]
TAAGWRVDRPTIRSTLSWPHKAAFLQIYQMRRQTPPFRAEISGADPVGVTPGCPIARCIDQKAAALRRILATTPVPNIAPQAPLERLKTMEKNH